MVSVQFIAQFWRQCSLFLIQHSKSDMSTKNWTYKLCRNFYLGSINPLSAGWLYREIEFWGNLNHNSSLLLRTAAPEGRGQCNSGSNSGVDSGHGCWKNAKIDQKAICPSWWCSTERFYPWKERVEECEWHQFLAHKPLYKRMLVDFVVYFMEKLDREIREMWLLVVARSKDCGWGVL